MTASLPRQAMALVAGMVLLGACQGPNGDRDESSSREEAGGDSVEVRDHQGRQVTLPAPPRRIISLVPSATAVLDSLGARDRLVARTDYDTAGALAHLPSVGGGLEPSMERVVSLTPQVVVRFDAESDPDTPARLDRARIPHVAVRPDGLGEIEEMVAMMGDLLARPDAARQLWGEMETGLEEVARNTPEHRPRVAFLLGGDPPLAAGPRTFLGELLEVAGARNVFQDLEDLYPPISVEELAARDIDRVLYPEGSALPELPPELEVSSVPGWVQQPGPRVAQAARELARAVHEGADR